MSEAPLARWRAEKASAWLYGVVAEAEADAGRARLFRDLAVEAERQAAILAEDLAEDLASAPAFRPDLRLQVVAALVRALGPRRCRSVLAAVKVRGLSVYDDTPVVAGHVMPKSVEDFGGRHRSVGGGNLRAAVFGVNDGLVSNGCLILGVAGASADSSAVLLAGTAGLLAGAFSMAAGEYVSVRSQRELFEYQIGQEREELETYPEEEAEELALIYAARGVPIDKAREITSALVKDPATALDALAREELGLNPDDLGSPIGASLASFASFAAGAFVPLLPFAAGFGSAALLPALALSALSLFAVGAALSLFSGRSAIAGGLRMLALGGAAGVATYSIGRLLGVGLA